MSEQLLVAIILCGVPGFSAGFFFIGYSKGLKDAGRLITRELSEEFNRQVSRYQQDTKDENSDS